MEPNRIPAWLGLGSTTFVPNLESYNNIPKAVNFNTLTFPELPYPSTYVHFQINIFVPKHTHKLFTSTW